MFNNSFFFYEKHAVYEMTKIMVQSDRPQMTILYGTCALHAGKGRLQTRNRNMLYGHFLSC